MSGFNLPGSIESAVLNLSSREVMPTSDKDASCFKNMTIKQTNP